METDDRYKNVAREEKYMNLSCYCVSIAWTQKYKKFPKGSLGLSIIGETLSVLKAQRKEQGAKWVQERILKYGPVFKTSLMGSPTVIVIGQADNKLILTTDDDVFATKQPATIQAIGGKNNLYELTRSGYKLIKGAMLSFLKPESLQTIERDTHTHHQGRRLHEDLTLNVACDILFGIKDEFTKERLFDDFTLPFKAIWSLPLNFLGAVFWKGLQARSIILDHEILRGREKGGGLSWGDIQKMRYTWRVAQELMRLIPALFGNFRKALKTLASLLWVACRTHMNGNIFERLDEFELSHFESLLRPIPPFTYVLLGGRLRTCIGNEFVRVKMLMVVHNLVTGHKWSQLEPEEAIACQFMPYPSWAC
ncbi:hypothetical protein BT93_K0789 [Corymbia citriodora subsp. variegata]|nr:hypothetical protein BT93_K0789 [Corymbia citriodora subsp. variegata]